MRASTLLPTILLAIGSLSSAAEPTLRYPVVGTGQVKCYDSRREIPPPSNGEPFYGQDAQFPGRAASYTRSADGLTVLDNVTGLTWQQSPDRNGDGVLNHADKLTFRQAQALPAQLNAAKFGGFNDWRLPTIKELYSLILFSGVDSGPNADSSTMRPFLDTQAFQFAYGDASAGERTIDSQWATCSGYTANPNQMFGVNFADGRIKGYGISMPGRGEKTFFVICVRGNPAYAKNDFRDNRDGTISDRATGLMWTRGDSGRGMNWQEALAWAQQKNKEKHLGHDDWRLPNAKELQSIVDYTRSPDTTGSPAIDPLFTCTAITNEIGKADFAFYWTGTTHASVMGGGNAIYIAFGRAAGWPTGMPGRGGGGPDGAPGRNGPPGGPGAGLRTPDPGRRPPDFANANAGAGNYQYVDVHGAGAQRSDPKSGDPAAFPHGHGPQGDVIRIYNFVRLVRADSAPPTNDRALQK
jgi:hypothetical protein